LVAHLPHRSAAVVGGDALSLAGISHELIVTLAQSIDRSMHPERGPGPMHAGCCDAAGMSSAPHTADYPHSVLLLSGVNANDPARSRCGERAAADRVP